MKETTRNFHRHKRAAGNRQRPTVAVLLRLVFLQALPLLVLAACVSPSERKHMEAMLTDYEQRNSQYDTLSIDSTRRLADFFSRHGDAHQRMRAYYLLGCAHEMAGESPQALDLFYKSLEQADTTASDCDYILLSKLHGRSGELLYNQFLPSMATKEYDMARYYAFCGKDSLLATNAFSQKAKCYTEMDKADSAMIVFEKASKMYLEQGDTLSGNTCLGPLAYHLICKGNLRKAKYCLDKYEHQSLLSKYGIAGDSDWQLLYVYKGDYFAKTGQRDSSLCYYRKANNSKNSNCSMLGSMNLYQLYMKEGRNDSVAKYAVRYLELNDSLYKISAARQLQQLHALYNYNRYETMAKRQSLMAERAKKNMAFLSCVLLLVVAAFLFGIYKQKTKHRICIQHLNARYVTDLMLYSKTKKELEVQKRMNTENDERIRQLSIQLKSLKDNIAKLQVDKKFPEEWSFADNLLDTYIVAKFHNYAITGKKPMDEDWVLLRKTIIGYLPLFWARLNSLSYKPNLKETEVCILVKLRFLPSEIGNLTGIKPSNLSNLRKKMLKKMFGKNGSSYEFDEEIRLLGN